MWCACCLPILKTKLLPQKKLKNVCVKIVLLIRSTKCWLCMRYEIFFSSASSLLNCKAHCSDKHERNSSYDLALLYLLCNSGDKGELRLPLKSVGTQVKCTLIQFYSSASSPEVALQPIKHYFFYQTRFQSSAFRHKQDGRNQDLEAFVLKRWEVIWCSCHTWGGSNSWF